MYYPHRSKCTIASNLADMNSMYHLHISFGSDLVMTANKEKLSNTNNMCCKQP